MIIICYNLIMEKDKNSQKEDFIKRLVEQKKKNDGITINQRAYKFNFNSDKPRVTYARQRIIFE